MRNFSGWTHNWFEEGQSLLLRGALVFGTLAVTLAVLIYLFPALLGFLFATLVLFAGVTAWFVAYKVWQFKKEFSKMEEGVRPLESWGPAPGYWHEDRYFRPRGDVPPVYFRRITFFMR